MRILLLSDIHANAEALEACLAASPARERVVNLGDVVGYGPNPNEVMAELRGLGAVSIRGNHDKACAGLISLDGFNSVAALAALWTRQALTPKNLEELKKFPNGPLLCAGCDGVQFVHGSPLDEDEYVLSPYDALDSLMRTRVPVTFFGHTHIQGGFSLEGTRGLAFQPDYPSGKEPQTYGMPLKRGVRYLLNPGSVGQPRDGDWRAGFAVFDSEAYAVTFYRVPYDIKTTQKKILDARLPERLAARLKEGR